jgi:hypothetical protein
MLDYTAPKQTHKPHSVRINVIRYLRIVYFCVRTLDKAIKSRCLPPAACSLVGSHNSWGRINDVIWLSWQRVHDCSNIRSIPIRKWSEWHMRMSEHFEACALRSNCILDGKLIRNWTPVSRTSYNMLQLSQNLISWNVTGVYLCRSLIYWSEEVNIAIFKGGKKKTEWNSVAWVR